MADYTAHEIVMNRWRNPKPMIKVVFPKGDGWKTRAQRLLRDGLNCYYSHRLGYVATPAKFAKFERLYAEGWDACVMTGRLEPPRQDHEQVQAHIARMNVDAPLEPVAD